MSNYEITYLFLGIIAWVTAGTFLICWLKYRQLRKAAFREIFNRQNDGATYKIKTFKQWIKGL